MKSAHKGHWYNKTFFNYITTYDFKNINDYYSYKFKLCISSKLSLLKVYVKLRYDTKIREYFIGEELSRLPNSDTVAEIPKKSVGHLFMTVGANTDGSTRCCILGAMGNQILGPLELFEDQRGCGS